ncbi:MAG: tRNA uridine-5-carboxymethylaminomethyl(34) synthesis GTPase MnmE, partial [Oscillospiraceae bacterium]
MKQGKNVAGPMLEPIAAIATGPNRCAIGIIRLSGRGVIETVSRLFTPKNGKPFDQSPDRKLVFGILHDGGGVPIDQALCTLTRGPNSYTGEDTAELQCHGSPMLLRLVLEALFQNGVRQAGPGEFTKRAF